MVRRARAGRRADPRSDPTSAMKIMALVDPRMRWSALRPATHASNERRIDEASVFVAAPASTSTKLVGQRPAEPDRRSRLAPGIEELSKRRHCRSDSFAAASCQSQQACPRRDRQYRRPARYESGARLVDCASSAWIHMAPSGMLVRTGRTTLRTASAIVQLACRGSTAIGRF